MHQKIGFESNGSAEDRITNANIQVNEEHHVPTLLCSRPLPGLEHSRQPNLYVRSLASRGAELREGPGNSSVRVPTSRRDGHRVELAPSLLPYPCHSLIHLRVAPCPYPPMALAKVQMACRDCSMEQVHPYRM